MHSCRNNGGVPETTPTTPASPADAAPARRIAHLDMDAFYASVELLRYPQLKGLPVVIGGGRRAHDEALDARYAGRLHEIPVDEFSRLKDYVGRGVITTATYPARQFGVGSAMGMMKAARLCPQAIMLPVDFAEVRRFSRMFKEIIVSIAPLMEDRGVDEVYIDFTDVPGGQREGGRVLARLIQKTITDATGLTCSIGVAPNKLLAKMASEFNKPNGISIVHEADLQTHIWPLACRKINGVGPKADEKLKSHGITTIGDTVIGDILDQSMILFPLAIDPLGRFGPIFQHFHFVIHLSSPLTFTPAKPNALPQECTLNLCASQAQKESSTWPITIGRLHNNDNASSMVTCILPQRPLSPHANNLDLLSQKQVHFISVTLCINFKNTRFPPPQSDRDPPYFGQQVGF